MQRLHMSSELLDIAKATLLKVKRNKSMLVVFQVFLLFSLL